MPSSFRRRRQAIFRRRLRCRHCRHAAIIDAERDAAPDASFRRFSARRRGFAMLDALKLATIFSAAADFHAATPLRFHYRRREPPFISYYFLRYAVTHYAYAADIIAAADFHFMMRCRLIIATPPRHFHIIAIYAWPCHAACRRRLRRDAAITYFAADADDFQSPFSDAIHELSFIDFLLAA